MQHRYHYISAGLILWNMYGNERIIVNTKSLSWSYDYGFFTTNVETVKFDRIGIGYEKVRGEGNDEIGRLVFYNYRKEDNLPEIIHETTVLLNLIEIIEFDKQIGNLFMNEFINERSFVPFSLN